MPEYENGSKHPFTQQNRFEWYQFNAFLQEMGQVSTQIGLQRDALVQLGGTALFAQCYRAFGPSAVFHFRGTHDVDALSFYHGAMADVLRQMEANGSTVTGFSECKSCNGKLGNKKTFSVGLRQGIDLALPDRFELDVFEPSFDAEQRAVGSMRFIDYSGRRSYPTNIVFDPPEVLELPDKRGQVVTPSLRDLFILKTDIVVDPEEKVFRPKDVYDLLVMLKISEALGIPFQDLTQSLVKDTEIKCSQIPALMREKTRAQRLKVQRAIHRKLGHKLNELERVYRNTTVITSCLPEGYPYLPVPLQRWGALEAIKSARKEAALPH